MRTTGSKNKDSFEFQKKFDALALKHGDPLVIMFKISGAAEGFKRGWSKNHRLEASKQLLSYRYPRLKAIEAKLEALDTQVEFSWLEAGIESLPNDNLPMDSMDAGHDTVPTKDITETAAPK